MLCFAPLAAQSDTPVPRPATPVPVASDPTPAPTNGGATRSPGRQDAKVGLGQTDPTGSVDTTLPSILTDADADTYAQIFNLQKSDKISDAKELESKLSDRMLMPDVLAQRYLSKTYKTSAKEISEWMQKYRDHPGADAMYKLAKLKKVHAEKPNLPPVARLNLDAVAKSETWTAKTYGGDAAREINRFKSALKHGNTKTARNILDTAAFKKLDRSDYGRLCGRLSFIYYADGEFDMAKKFGIDAAKLNSEYGLWTMGLLSFKTANYADAQKYFSDMLNIPQINPARKLEVLFWAGRSAEANDDIASAKKYWTEAAARPMTFYGALSDAMLGNAPKYEFFDSEWNANDIAELMKNGYGVEALALLQIGERDLAESHLQYLIAPSSSDQLLHAVHSIASVAELPRASMQVSAMLSSRDITEIDPNIISTAQYPLPDWEPTGGWSIDRALLFAITRQESAFKTDAKSRVGASGLMQLMPKTAKLTARNQDMDMADLDITDPNDNMFLGQQHIVDLLALPAVDNNVIKMLVSYNAGPGAMLKWEKQFQTDDPLLFIESFPATETRTYVKRVLANLWLYRARLNQPTTTIQDLADGKWPRYESNDNFAVVRDNNDNI